VATLAVGPILDSANLTYVSPSATLASLTDGSLKHFFRVVANDSVQGPDIANFIASDLSPRRVLVVGDSGAYSAALSKAITSVLAEKGVEVSRSSVDLKKPDPNAVLKAMTPDTNVVVLTGDSPVAQSVADAIAAEEFHPVIVATDNMFDLDKFDVPGAYVFSFSPSVENVDGGERLLQTYRAIFGDLEPYGGPAYVAMQVILTAALDSCDNHEATRAGVTRGIRQVVLPSTILGYPVAFDSRGDLTGGRFFRYRIEGGRFVAQQDR
jgi:branched-chain amino acid transport system substrate-binding protein